jgi:hypothetical protein
LEEAEYFHRFYKSKIPMVGNIKNAVTEKSGESTGRSQNISLIVPLFTFAGHYRGIRML